MDGNLLERGRTVLGALLVNGFDSFANNLMVPFLQRTLPAIPIMVQLTRAGNRDATPRDQGKSFHLQ